MLADALAEEAAQHPDLPVEVFATYEHRLNLKPVTGRVWSSVGERPVALGHHRFDWLYVTDFASPAMGETFWYLSNGVSKPFFEASLETFAREAGAGVQCIILLVLDNAGSHGSAGLEIPNGIRLVYLPPYTPELQPAETLWALVDDLEEKIAARCIALADAPETIKIRTDFHWWPKPIIPN